MTAAPKLMTADEFLVWCLDQDDKWELVGGVPVRPSAMTGATQRHDQIVVNMIVCLGNRLRGQPCRPTTDDVAFKAVNGDVLRPDVTVECGGDPDTSLASRDPRVVVEVLSPSTRQVDLIRKLEAYKAHPGLRHIVMIEPDRIEVLIWSRPEADTPWALATLTDLDADLAFDALDIRVPLSEVYDRIAFEDVTT
ncbi:MAG: Uma2 family endonuclease [Maricaulaceae bacterium]